MNIVSLFHPRLQTIITSAGNVFRVPMQVPVAAMLATGAAAIGRARVLRIRDGWVEPARLNIAVVGESGIGKSPCQGAFLNRLFDRNAEERLKWQEALTRWRQSPRDRDPGNPPRRKQFILDVGSLPAIAGALEANPRGILIYNDELTHLLGRVSSKNGSTNELHRRLIEADGSQDWCINYANPDKDIEAKNATISVFGNIQPAFLPETFGAKDMASGLLPRFIFMTASWINKVPLSRQGFTHAAELDGIIESLLGFELGADGKSGIIDMTDEAFELFSQWELPITQEHSWDGAKLVSQAIRLCLILHCLDAVCEGRSEMDPVTPETMARALEFANWLRTQRQEVADRIRAFPQARQLNEKARDTIKAILELCPQDQEKIVPTQEIHARLTSWGHVVSLHEVGKLCGALGLEKSESNKQSRWRISREKLANWRRIMGHEILTMAPAESNATNATDFHYGEAA